MDFTAGRVFGHVVEGGVEGVLGECPMFIPYRLLIISLCAMIQGEEMS